MVKQKQSGGNLEISYLVIVRLLLTAWHRAQDNSAWGLLS